MMDEESFRRAEDEFFSRIAAAGGMDELSSMTVALLHDLFPHYGWTGIYWLRGNILKLGPWKGPEATEHVSIPLGSGVCGAAASSGRIENVPDVNADGRYLACFLHTRSEIVVPLFSGGRVIGEIDIDGDQLAAFGARDESFLKKVANLFEGAPGIVEGT